MTTLLLANGITWNDVFLMTGIGVGIVFVILLVLVFMVWGFKPAFSCLDKFTSFFNDKIKPIFNFKKNKTNKQEVQQLVSRVQPKNDATDTETAAVAMALYLFYKDVHDVETDVLTIKHNRNSAWHHELNKTF